MDGINQNNGINEKNIEGILEEFEKQGKKKNKIPFKQYIKEKRWPTYLLAFALPMLIMFLIYGAMEVYPFGKGSVLVLDLNGQYVYFFEELRNKILNGGSLMYSWGRALGGEFMGIFAYYIASPFSFLVALFPQENITEALLVIFLLKVGSCSFTMSVYLDRFHPSSRLNTVIFSVMYALCSYAIVYMHNTMWIDEMIFLPMLVMGTEILITKRKPFMYIASLAFCCMTSFYIGYMMCIFTFLYFFYYYFAHDKGMENNLYEEKGHFIKSLLRIALYSAIAIAISMIIILPAYTSLQFGKSDFTNPDYTFTQKFDFLDMIAKLYPGTYDTVRPEGLPWLYCGTISMVLFPLYFVSKHISTREKIFTGALLLSLVLSFNGSTIDIIWHGFQKPNWLNYRYSFTFTFIFILCAYKVFCHLEDIDYKLVLGSISFYAVLILILQKMEIEWLDDFTVVWFSLACLGVYAIALHPINKQYLTNVSRSVILIIVSVELFLSGVICEMGLDDDVLFSKRTAYRNYMDKFQPVVDYIKDYDTENFSSEFFRMEKDSFKKTNDNMTLGYYGVSCSSSTLNESVIQLLAKMGYASMSHWSKYYGGEPVADSLLGLKYVIKTEDYNEYLWQEIYTDEEQELYAYYNPYTIDLACAVSSAIYDINIEDYDTPFEFLNDMVTAMLGETKQVKLFKAITGVGTDEENLDIAYASGNRKYIPISSAKTAKLTYTFDAVGDNEIFCYFPTVYKKEVSLKLNGVDYGSYFTSERYRILSLGTYSDGEEVMLSMTLEDNCVYIQSGVKYFYYLDYELFKEIMPRLLEGNMEITHFEDTRVEGKVTATADCSTIYTSIPYDEGWKVYVDGEQVEINRAFTALLAFDVDEGEHDIVFVYYPDCVKYGIIISLCGLAAFAAVTVIYKKVEKKRKARWVSGLEKV